MKIWFDFSSLRGWDVREQFEKRARDYRVVPFEVLGSFCNFVCGGQGWGVFAERGGEGSVDYGIGLKGFQLFEAAMEGSLDAGVVAGEPIELGGVLIAWIGFQQANTAQVPGGGDQFIEQCLLDGALGFDVCYKIGEQAVEYFLLTGGDDDLASGEAVFRGVLRGARFSGGGAGSSGMQRIGGVGRETSGGSRHSWVSGKRINRRPAMRGGKWAEVVVVGGDGVGQGM